MTQTVQAALQDLQDQIDSITFTFATSIAPKSVNANQVNASTLQTLTSQTGTLTINDGGSVASGQSQYNTGTGFFLGTNGGVAQMSLGNPSGNNMTWDGTNLTITGAVNATSGTIGGWTIGATTLSATSLVLDAGNSKLNFTVPTTSFSAINFQQSGGSSTAALSSFATTTHSDIALSALTTAGSQVGLLLDAQDGGLDSIQLQIGGLVPLTINGSSVWAQEKIIAGGGIALNGANLNIGWDATHTAVGITGAPLELDHAFYPATTGNATQNTISLQVNAGFGLQLNGAQLSMTGAASTSIWNVATVTLQNGSPTTTLPAGVAGIPVFMNGVSGYLAFYHL